MDSILNTIKKLLGIPLEQENFDTDVIIHINSAFTRLWELGVGPSECFRITDSVDIWDDFLLENTSFEDVKDYVYLKVRLKFDPPASSAYLATIKESIAEYEWRLTVRAETEAKNQNGEM